MIRRQLFRTTLLLSFTAGLVLPVGALASPQSGSRFSTNEELETFLGERVAEGRAEEIVVGLRDADGITRVVAVGASGADSRPSSEEPGSESSSFAGAFTGILLADMARRGEVDLSDPVARHLPDDVRMPRENGREITLFDLATHHSGLPMLPSSSGPGDSGKLDADDTVREMYDFLAGVEIERKIGSEYAFSELGTALLGHALSRRAGLSYEELVRDRILEPLQMAGTGALRSSARDLLRLIEANLGAPGTGLERSMRVAREPRLAISQGAGDGPALIGLAWRIRSSADARIVWHEGGNDRSRTFVGFDPVREIGVVVLARSRQPVDDIGFELLDPGAPLSDVGP